MSTAKTALVTGSAGFIGFHLSKRLLNEGYRVIGFDAMSDYYDVVLKQRRHAILGEHAAFEPVIAHTEDEGRLTELCVSERPEIIVHLAAQAGVRYSLEAPRSYVQSNLVGALELLEAARAAPPKHLLMASTSSVYGANTEMPYRETAKADHQMSFYAATKKANEAMAHSYAHLYGLPITMFRFFTVYGPWGRPDMALFKFVKAILEGRPIDIYNHGDMRRDFTYIDDLIEGLVRLIGQPPVLGAPIEGDSLSPVAPWRVLNVGHGTPERLEDFVTAIEQALGTPALRNYMDMQPGDVPATWADNALLTRLTGTLPRTPLADGVAAFVEWYKSYYASAT
ncbi:NAD-dependent epimerase/dehydratase family protein [Salipiger bermudensis]|uniref:NAD-dependent epimerase/dehydratase family protein n=1 Tax=Salipiger bermudensis TaxID=344736 RepID=UPI001A8C02CC|nr:NAD-dependent epimerase/dehydratase family protein [Salipiger bermudensis]MBN9677522.1 NAD-dependent epimerase/dehydratase family protein [Salipiger bermudensis]MBR9893646.1 NAD-dependent epimerase/dehydratase family protein [bacterium]MCA1287407.1 NAD-dependent epimerase/dehydratase family protein [Salipiger bermudensis]